MSVANKGIRNFESHRGRNKGHFIPDDWRSLPYGLLRRNQGILVGTGIVYIMNAWLANTRIVLFLLTPRLLVIAMLFALLIGALSGLYPAYRASKMSPMEALKHA